jgi:hypothetical protein
LPGEPTLRQGGLRQDEPSWEFNGLTFPAQPCWWRPMSGLSHLDRLEAESIHIMRETVAEAD